MPNCTRRAFRINVSREFQPLLIFPAVLLVLAACNTGPKPAPTGTLPPARLVVQPFQSPTPTPLPTPTLTVQEAIYPYTVAGLREHRFKSGNISLLHKTVETRDYIRYEIAYPSDGLTITGLLQIPANGEPPFPVVIMNHGFFTRGDFSSGDGTDRAAEFLNRRGYLTISPDYRSWGDSDIGPSLFYSGLVIDVVNLIEALPSLPQADPNRIGMWGHSMGGGVTMKVLMLETPVRGAVLYSTVSADDADLIGRWGPGCIGDIATGERYYGCNSSDILPVDMPGFMLDAYLLAASDPELLRATSPIHHLDLVKAPVQIHYGTEDGQTSAGTPPEWSKKLHAALVEAGARSELYGYDGQGHSFLADSWFALMERTARFFDRELAYP